MHIPTLRVASIQETSEHKRVFLALIHDSGDGRYRWLQANDAADTEVSGKTIKAAVEAGRAAWRSWDFKIHRTRKG